MLKIAVFLCAVLLSCRQPGMVTPPSQRADSLVSFIKVRLNQSLLERDLPVIKAVLDSLYPVIEILDHPRSSGTWLVYRAIEKEIANEIDSANFFNNLAWQTEAENDTTRSVLLRVLIEKATLLGKEDKSDSAIYIGLKAYDLSRDIDTTSLPLICYRLFENAARVGDLDLMRRFGLEGYQRAPTPVVKIAFANAVYIYYIQRQMTDSATYFFQQVQADTVLAPMHFRGQLYLNFGSMLIESGKPALAIPYVLKAADMLRQTGEPIPKVFFNIALSYHLLQQPGLSNAYLDSIEVNTIPGDKWGFIKEIWALRSENYKIQGRYLLAKTAMDSAMVSYNIQMDSSLLEQARELEARYAAQVKDKAIESLSLSNQLHQRINAQQRMIIFSMAMAGILVVVLLFLLWRRRQAQIRLKQVLLQQQLLRSQMNPHIIFNTLNILQRFIRAGDSARALSGLSKISHFIRLTLENAREQYVPLQDEVNALEYYLHLQQSIYVDRFDYEIALFDSFAESSLLIPPMLLQPFVENAILHGIKNSAQKGMVSIRVDKLPGMLSCRIEDNGVGLESPGEKGERRSLSTAITTERLQLLARQTGRPASLEIYDKASAGEGQGVVVLLTIPFKTAF